MGTFHLYKFKRRKLEKRTNPKQLTFMMIPVPDF